MNFIIEGSGALVNEAGEETPLKAGDFALVNPDDKHQYRNKATSHLRCFALSLQLNNNCRTYCSCTGNQ